jgi:hypothetical protein
LGAKRCRGDGCWLAGWRLRSPTRSHRSEREGKGVGSLRSGQVFGVWDAGRRAVARDDAGNGARHGPKKQTASSGNAERGFLARLLIGWVESELGVTQAMVLGMDSRNRQRRPAMPSAGARTMVQRFGFESKLGMMTQAMVLGMDRQCRSRVLALLLIGSAESKPRDLGSDRGYRVAVFRFAEGGVNVDWVGCVC